MRPAACPHQPPLGRPPSLLLLLLLLSAARHVCPFAVITGYILLFWSPSKRPAGGRWRVPAQAAPRGASCLAPLSAISSL